MKEIKITKVRVAERDVATQAPAIPSTDIRVEVETETGPLLLTISKDACYGLLAVFLSNLPDRGSR